MFRLTWIAGIAGMALLAASAVSTPAVAQTTPPTGQTDPARLAMARTLVQTMRSEQQARALQARSAADATADFDRIVPTQVAMRYQLSDPQGFAKIREQVIKLIVDDREQMIGETVPLIIDAEVRRYADHFSTAELRALNDFYLTPTGQRLIAEQPAMALDNGRFQQGVLRAIAAAHSSAITPKLAAVLSPILRQATQAPPAPGRTP